jgi:hypothetical protein
MPIGQKHLIQCRCVMTQFKKMTLPPAHQFPVFSIISDDDMFVSKYAQCTNCGLVHNVIEIGKSNIIQGREAMATMVTIDDIKHSLFPPISQVLERNNADLPTWEAVQFIVENKQWGNFVVMTVDNEAGMQQGKYIRILGENMFKVETYSRSEVI